MIHRQSSDKWKEQGRVNKLPINAHRFLITNSQIRSSTGDPTVQRGYPIFFQKMIENVVERKKCGICENNEEQLLSLAKCEHQFCLNCLIAFVQIKVNLSEEIHCPAQDCIQLMDQKSSFYQHLPINIKEKHQKNKLWRQNINNPDVRLCPRQNCKNGLINLKLNPPICQKCRTTFCKECQLQAHSGPCQKIFEDRFKAWKRCPKCKMFIQKIEGCNHMVCRCKHEFCFICLDNWDSQHYQCNQQSILFDPQPQLQNRNLGYRIFLTTLGILFLPILLGVFVIIAVFILLVGIIGSIIAPFIIIYSAPPQCKFCSILALPFILIISFFVVMYYCITTVLLPACRSITRKYCRLFFSPR